MPTDVAVETPMRVLIPSDRHPRQRRRGREERGDALVADQVQRYTNIAGIAEAMLGVRPDQMEPLTRVLSQLQQYGTLVGETPQIGPAASDEDDQAGQLKQQAEELRVLKPKGDEPFDATIVDRDDKRRHLRILAAPYAYLVDCVSPQHRDIIAPLCYELARYQQMLDEFNYIKRLLISDREEKIRKGLERVKELPHREQLPWLTWLAQSSDGSLQQLVSEYFDPAEMPPQFLSEGQEDVPKAPKPLSAIEVARQHPVDQEKWRAFFQGNDDVVDYGRLGGEVTKRQPSPFEAMISEVMEDLPHAEHAWDATMVRLANVADILRYQGQAVTLDAPRAIEAIINACEQLDDTSPLLGESTWNLLTRFTIPESEELSSNILHLMDITQGLHHPLAMRLMCELPPEHSFIQEQNKRIAHLTELCNGTPEEVMARYADCVEVTRGIVSYYPNGFPSEKVGFDMEMWPKVLGVPLPDKIVMETDYGFQIPEVRIDANGIHPQALYYDRDWRKRMYDYWLYLQTSAAQERSVHVHVDRSDMAFESVVKAFYGDDYNDVKTNGRNPTIEIRIPLSHYTDYYSATRSGGYSDGAYFFPTADFLLTLRNVPNTMHLPNEGTRYFDDPHQQRFALLLATTDDPSVRASGLIALQSNMGLRMKNNISHDDEPLHRVDSDTQPNELYYLLERIGFYSQEERKAIFDLCAADYNSNRYDGSYSQLCRLVPTLAPDDRLAAFEDLCLLNVNNPDDNFTLLPALLPHLYQGDILAALDQLVESDYRRNIHFSTTNNGGTLALCLYMLPAAERISFISNLQARYPHEYCEPIIDASIPAIEKYPDSERADFAIQLLESAEYSLRVCGCTLGVLNRFPAERRLEIVEIIRQNFRGGDGVDIVTNWVLSTNNALLSLSDLERRQFIEDGLSNSSTCAQAEIAQIAHLYLWDEAERLDIVMRTLPRLSPTHSQLVLTDIFLHLDLIPEAQRPTLFDALLSELMTDKNVALLLASIDFLPEDLREHYRKLITASLSEVSYGYGGTLLALNALAVYTEDERMEIFNKAVDELILQEDDIDKVNDIVIAIIRHLVLFPKSSRIRIITTLLDLQTISYGSIAYIFDSFKFLDRDEQELLFRRIYSNPDSDIFMKTIIQNLQYAPPSLIPEIYRRAIDNDAAGLFFGTYQQLDRPQWVPLTDFTTTP